MKAEHYQKKDIVDSYQDDRFWNQNGRRLSWWIKESGAVVSCLKPGKTLDLACGEGRLGFLNEYMGIDLSKEMITKARSKYPNSLFCVGNAYDLDCSDNLFDNVVALRLFLHLDDWKKAFDEMYRVCKPKGRIIFDVRVPNPYFVFKKLIGQGITTISLSQFSSYKVLKVIPIVPFMEYVICIEKDNLDRFGVDRDRVAMDLSVDDIKTVKEDEPISIDTL